MLVDHCIGTGICIRVRYHVIIQRFRCIRDFTFPQGLVVQEDQCFEVNGKQILSPVQLPCLDGHGKCIGQQRVGIYDVRERSKDVHGYEGSQDIMGVEIHVRTIGCITAVQL